MSVYYYIAQINPDESFSVCRANGFTDIYTTEELADTLQVIAASGESGLKQVLEIHPDKEVILELFEIKPKQMQTFMRADGKPTSKLVSQTNAFILVGAIIVSLAIISSKT